MGPYIILKVVVSTLIFRIGGGANTHNAYRGGINYSFFDKCSPQPHKLDSVHFITQILHVLFVVCTIQLYLSISKQTPLYISCLTQ